VAARVDDLFVEVDRLADDGATADALAIVARLLARKTLTKPQRIKALLLRALLCGDDTLAATTTTEALRLRPTAKVAVDLLEIRAMARYNRGDYRGAREDLAKAVAKDDEVPASTHTLRGMAALLLDEPREAIADFTNALAIDREDVKALAQRAKAYEVVNDHKRALADLDRIAKLVEPSPLLDIERERLRSRSRRTRAR
jgi:tetratricopeptide (TPR) repeat protein